MPQLITSLDATGFDPEESTGFEPYEGPKPTPGVYAAIIRKISVRIGNTSGEPYLNVLFELAHQQTSAKEKYKGYPHFDRFFLNDKDFNKKMLSKLVASVTGGKVKAAIKHDPVEDGGAVTKLGGKDPVGTQLRVVIARDNEYNGEAQIRISDLYAWPKDVDWPAEAPEPDEDDEEVEDSTDDEPEEVDEEEVDETDDSAEDEADDEESEEEDEAEEDEEESDEEEDEEEEEEEDDDVEAAIEARREELTSMTRTQIKKVLTEVNPDAKVLKKDTDADLVEKVIDAEYPVEGEPPF